MKVTGYDIRKSTFDSAIAFGKIVVEGAFEVDIQIKKGKNGMFVSYPGKKGKDGKWYSQFKFIDRELSDKIQDQVIFFYEQNIKDL